MIAVQTAVPSPRLRKFVRIYAQRRVDAFESGAAMVAEPMPARLEQTLEFQFGELFDVHHWDGRSQQIQPVAIIGAQVNGCASVDLRPGVVSFAIFFRPAGYSRLFDIAPCELTNRNYDGCLLPARLGQMRARLRECVTFDQRVHIVENLLFALAARSFKAEPMITVAEHIFNLQGAVRISQLASQTGLSVRQFERNFQRSMGLTPKLFARVARFQTALDAKIAAPERTWAEIAHHLCYFDQMHMIRDFELLGGSTPRQLLDQIGDARPVALPRQFEKK